MLPAVLLYSSFLVSLTCTDETFSSKATATWCKHKKEREKKECK